MNKPVAFIIEDNEDLAALFSEVLESADYETEIIYDGQTAMSRLAQSTPDVIILDMHLPHIDGRKILDYVRAEPRLAETRVVVATADPGSAAGRPTVQANTVLIKPIRPQQLRHLVSRLRPSEEA
ncbi:MAG: response regulator [Chloroflexi bacterium]|nr:MAG: response regulator [Chloroflexota bacterium]